MFYDRPFWDINIFDFNPETKKNRKLINDIKRMKNYYVLFELISSMFTYTGLPWRQEFIEELLMGYGWAAIGKDENGLHIGYIAYTDLDENNIPIGPATLTTRHAYQMDGVIDENIVLGFNNNIRLPELKIQEYADMFSEADISIKSIIKKARLNPVPLARDSKVQKALNDIMGEIEEGNTKAIAYDAIRDDLFEGSDPVTILHLTEPEHTDKLQYMSKFYDDQLRRFMTFYGHPLSSASKMAQVTAAELEGYTTYSRIYPEILLKERQAFIDEANRLFGTDLSVDYSKAWEHLKNDIVLNNEEVTNDEINGDTGEAESSEQDADTVDKD